MAVEVGSYIRIGTNLVKGYKGDAVIGVAADVPPTSSGNYCVYYQLGNGYTGSLGKIQSMIGAMTTLSISVLNNGLIGPKFGVPLGGSLNDVVLSPDNATYDGMILFIGNGVITNAALMESSSHYFDVTTKELRNLWLEQAKDN